MTEPTLHLLCGKMAAGKSTLAARLAAESGGVLLAEDAMTAALWPGELTSIAAYADRSERLKRVIWPIVMTFLQTGVSVVLDFPANTPKQRLRLRELIHGSGAAHVLHVLDAADSVCLARLRARNAEGVHPFAPTEADFHAFTKFFTPPMPDEGFNVRVWPDAAEA